MKAKPKTKVKEKLEPHVYIGDAVNMFGKITQQFKDKKGAVLTFSGIKGVYINDTYMIDVANGQMKTKPEAVADSKLKMTDEDWLKYEGNKIAIKLTREKRRKDMQLRQPHGDIVKAIKLLRPFCRNMDLLTLGRFIGYIENQLSKKEKRK